MSDIQEFNKDINDGYDSVKIEVHATKRDLSLRKFNEIKDYLVEKYPVLKGNIEFVDYPIPKSLVLSLHIIEIFSILIIMCTVFFKYIHFSNAYFVSFSAVLVQHRVSVLLTCYFLYFILNDIIYNYHFEVYIDSSQVFSKTKKFRFPTKEEIKDLLDQYMKTKIAESKKTI